MINLCYAVIFFNNFTYRGAKNCRKTVEWESREDCALYQDTKPRIRLEALWENHETN